MKILYIAPYKQNDGWGEAAKDYALALAATKHEICARPLFIANINNNIPDTITLLEQNKFDKYDALIQFCLPHMLDYNGVVGKNIGLFMLETNNTKYSLWYKFIQTMDSNWVSSLNQALTLQKDGINNCKVIPIPVNTSKFAIQYDRLNLNLYDSFNFYYIGNYIQRKNLASLVTAFHLEFHRNEPVNLVIKSNGKYQPKKMEGIIKEQIKKMKILLRIYHKVEQYKEEIIITQTLTEEELNSLHQSCHCFVMPSFGEAWCRPAIDALGFGNTPIVTKYTGMSFINDKNGWKIEAEETPVITDEPPLPFIYNGYETWMETNIMSIRECMREAYENSKAYQKKSDQGKKDIEQYSYNNVAKLIEEALT